MFLVHQYARVVCPSSAFATNGLEDLLALKDLLVEATGVEGLGALERVFEWYEYLHSSFYFFLIYSKMEYCFADEG